MDKNIFNEAIPTEDQKARLKGQIFKADTENEDNKMKRVFPFKATGMIAAAFVLVIGVTALIGVFVNSLMVTSPPAMYSSGSDNHIASNGGADNADKITIEVTDLREKYPQYFDLDTTKGLVIYAWYNPADVNKSLCVLVSSKNIGYTNDEIATMTGITTAQMKAILSGYNIDKESITVQFFPHPSSPLVDEPTFRFVEKVRRELGLDDEVTDLREKYPQYFDLDTTGKGLEVYVWQPAPDSYSCVLVESRNRAHTDDEIMALPEATLADMKEILSCYDIPPEMIEVAIFQHPTSSFLADINQSFIPMIRERLGITLESYDEWGINVSVAFKNDTEFVLSIGQALPEGVHMDGQLTTSPEYELYVDYDGKRITYREYAELKGLQYNGPFVWNAVLYTIEENGWLTLNEDISRTYGKLPEGKYYIKKNIVYYGDDNKREEKNYFAPFEIKEKPTIPENEKDKTVSIVNGVEVKLGEGEYLEGSEDILDFDFAVVYELPTYYYDFYTENGGNLPDVAIPDENRTYKKIRAGDKLGEGLTVTSAYFNSYVTRDESGNATGFDIKTSMHGLKAEGNVTVTAYAYKDSNNADGREYVKFVIDPTKNGNLIDYDLFYGPSVNYFSYVNEIGGLFDAKSSTPVLTLAEEYNGMFDREGLWEVELDITAISIAHIGRGTGVPVTVDVSDIRFIRELEVSGPVAE